MAKKPPQGKSKKKNKKAQLLPQIKKDASVFLSSEEGKITKENVIKTAAALGIIGAALLIFTLSMDEIAVSFFLIGRDNTLPLEIWGRLRRGITPEINAISTVLFVFSLVAIVGWYRLRTKGSSEVGGQLVEAP